MKIKQALGNFMRSSYHSPKSIASVIIAVSYLLIAINSGWGFFSVMLAPDFLPAFAFTLTMASLFTVYIHELHLTLFGRFQSSLDSRYLCNCLFMGIVLPVFLDLLLVQLYFLAKGESIFTNTFFDIDFILIVSYIVVLNIAYGLANINQRRLALLKQKHQWQLALLQKELLTVANLQRLERIKKLPVSLADLDLDSAGIKEGQIACAYKIDGKVTVHYFGKQQAEVKQSINKIFEPLNEMEYFKINSTCFHHRLLIFSYEENVSSRRLYLRLRHPFNHLNHNQQRIVSQGMAVGFRKWFDQV